MKIYTKGGDKGETALLDGSRVSKDHPHVEAYGTIDECNSHIGLSLSLLDPTCQDLALQLRSIQNDLFEIGSALSLPLSSSSASRKHVRDNYHEETQQLEKWIDQWTSQLPPLKNFILPGGHPSASALHLARTSCRHAERLATPIYLQKKVSQEIIIYLNRLSDYLFTACRAINQQTQFKECIWQSKTKKEN